MFLSIQAHMYTHIPISLLHIWAGPCWVPVGSYKTIVETMSIASIILFPGSCFSQAFCTIFADSLGSMFKIERLLLSLLHYLAWILVSEEEP